MKRKPLLVLLALLSAGAAAEPLGRLFFTPEQRVSADGLRAAASVGTTQRLDGLLTRSSGKATLWVNGQAQHGGRAALGIPGPARDRARLAIDGGPAVLLRVGESIDAVTREKNDVVAPDTIRKSH